MLANPSSICFIPWTKFFFCQESASAGARASQQDSETASTLQASLFEVESLAETLREEKVLLEQRLEEAAENAQERKARKSTTDRQLVSFTTLFVRHYR